MEFMQVYGAGLSRVLDPAVLAFLFLGGAVGVVIGALPGLGPTMAVSVLLPLTLRMSPETAFSLLLSVYAGATYGGSITAILVNIPGTPSALMTVIDGYPMARKGEAGLALTGAAGASFLGGLFSALALALFAPPLAAAALRFSSQEYFAVIIFGLSLTAYITSESMLKGLLACAIGLLLGTVGSDPITALPRFTFGSTNLLGGIELVPLLIGLFGVAEVLDLSAAGRRPQQVERRIGRLLPRAAEVQGLVMPVLRSSVIGTFIGALPGAGGSIAATLAYGVQKRLSRHPERMGKGALEGVVAPETANNAAVGGAMIPMLTLGIPGDATTAVLVGALMMHGLAPGPTLFSRNPEIVSSIFILTLLSQFLILLYGIPCVRWFARVVELPHNLFVPGVLVLSVLGTFAVRNNLFDVGVLIAAGALGYVMRRVGLPPAPLILGFVLSGLLESHFRRALILSRGDFSEFFTRPISLAFLLLTATIFASVAAAALRRRRDLVARTLPARERA